MKRTIKFRGVDYIPTIATATESRIATEKGIIAEARTYPNEIRKFVYPDGMEAIFKLSTDKAEVVLFLTSGTDVCCTIHKV